MNDLVVIQSSDLRNLLSEVVERALEDARPARARAETPTGAPTVRGLDPHALYSRSTVAERWDCSIDTVRKTSDLAETEWPGKQTRYRGVDVLRAEGVPESEILAVTRPALPLPSTSRRSGRPPKVGMLPKL